MTVWLTSEGLCVFVFQPEALKLIVYAECCRSEMNFNDAPPDIQIALDMTIHMNSACIS